MGKQKASYGTKCVVGTADEELVQRISQACKYLISLELEVNQGIKELNRAVATAQGEE